MGQKRVILSFNYFLGHRSKRAHLRKLFDIQGPRYSHFPIPTSINFVYGAPCVWTWVWVLPNNYLGLIWSSSGKWAGFFEFGLGLNKSGLKWVGFKMNLNKWIANKLGWVNINHFINLNIKILKFHTIKRKKMIIFELLKNIITTCNVIRLMLYYMSFLCNDHIY